MMTFTPPNPYNATPLTDHIRQIIRVQQPVRINVPPDHLERLLEENPKLVAHAETWREEFAYRFFKVRPRSVKVDGVPVVAEKDYWFIEKQVDSSPA